jgi:E3 ubiquitin-protein ligase SHPRH
VVAQASSSRPRKRAKTVKVHDYICLAREQITVTCAEAGIPQGLSAITRTSVGHVLALELLGSSPEEPARGTYRVQITPRASYRGPGFCVCASLDDSSLTAKLRAVLRVAETQGFDPGEEGCLWAAVDISICQNGGSVELNLSFEVRWNERTTLWGSGRLNSASQQTLRDGVFETLYPNLDLPQARSTQPSWFPQDFYQAACIPDKETLDLEVSSMKIEKLEADLYPFQRRAVQWLLRREGVHWHQDTQSNQAGVCPYVSPTSSEPPISFTQARDVDGNEIYLSPLFGAATKRIALFRSLQHFRGGILAEEMGLGKTLEMIALILLHSRPTSSVMVYDPFLGRELLATPATLIVAPSSLLDQWLSELNRHAPSLKVMFYPGVKKSAKMKDGSEISAEYLAEQDVVVTTYEVLRTEIWAASDEPLRSMRNEKQYERRRSPLVQLLWWRVCIDEAQMVENWTNNAAKLARMIPRINAWAVTGTPVKDDIQKGKKSSNPPRLSVPRVDIVVLDLRGLLLFLRYEPYASDTKIWNHLTTFDKASFQKIFSSISMRHSKSLVRNEIAIPPQKRCVITMPFTAVEEQHYQSLFEELAETCGLDARGAPLQGDWDPEDPAVQSAMRVALDRLRQTVLHPEVGNRNRRALGQKAGPMRTVAEVLDAMLEQTDSARRTDQRNLLSAKLLRGHVLACQKREKDALTIWQEVLATSTEMVADCRAQLSREIQEARKGDASESRPEPSDGDAEDREDAVPPRVGEARRRLRSALEIQHRAVFFCANGYFSMKSNQEITVPDSDDFKRLEKLEMEAYDRAKEIRKEILQEVRWYFFTSDGKKISV